MWPEVHTPNDLGRHCAVHKAPSIVPASGWPWLGGRPAVVLPLPQKARPTGRYLQQLADGKRQHHLITHRSFLSLVSSGRCRVSFLVRLTSRLVTAQKPAADLIKPTREPGTFPHPHSIFAHPHITATSPVGATESDHAGFNDSIGPEDPALHHPLDPRLPGDARCVKHRRVSQDISGFPLGLEHKPGLSLFPATAILNIGAGTATTGKDLQLHS